MTLRVSVAVSMVLALALVSGCKPTGSGGGSGGGGRKFLSLGTAPSGGAFAPVGDALAETLNEFKGQNNWNAQPKGTKGSQENIRLLEKGELDFALSNASITYFAVRGEGTFQQKHEVRSVMTLAPNVGMFLSKRGSGIDTMADLKGKRVATGPAGAGFEMFVGPILEAHSLSYNDIQDVNATQSNAVEYLADGSVSAIFLGGAPPTGSIIQACSSPGFDIHFIPFDEQARQQLIERYSFFKPFTIPQSMYNDLEGDFQGLNVGSMHLITTADQDEELVYQVAKTLYEQREAMAQKHGAGKSIEKNATLDVGVPFHPGAIRYYQEIGIWEEAGKSPSATEPAEEAN